MIQLADARRIIAAAEKKAEEIGQPMNIAVVDEGGNLVALVRMDDAWLGCIDISQKKAWTSRAFDITTKDLGDTLPVRRPVLRHPRLQRRQGHDLRRRHPAEERRQGRRRHRRQRRHRRAGSRRRRSRRSRLLSPCADPSETHPPSLQSIDAARKSSQQKEIHGRAIAESFFSDQNKVEVQSIDFPKMQNPAGKKIDHGVILKVVSTNICGSDQHMVRGRTTAPTGLVLGHEITGEVIEAGTDVEYLKIGDLVSVPFNVACGRCRTCREQQTGVCLNVNPGRAGGAYGYVDMGGWVGGQAEYVMVPYADFNLIKFPDKAQAMEKIRTSPCSPTSCPPASTARSPPASASAPPSTSPAPARSAWPPRPLPRSSAPPSSWSAT